MDITIFPTKIDGSLQAPASKSCMQRACAIALLHEGRTIIRNSGRSYDEKAALSIIQQFGGVIDFYPNGDLCITGNPDLQNCAISSIQCKESGLSLRLFSMIASLCDHPIVLEGEGSLLNRPIHAFKEIFETLGVEFTTNQGLLPISIKGPIRIADVEMNAVESSQYLSALLIVFAKKTTIPVQVWVKELKSKPYVDLTMDMLDQFGCNIQHHQYKQFYIKPSSNKISLVDYTVEGDWSGASFLLVAGAIAGKVEVKGLLLSSKQADRSILQVLSAAGATVSISDDSICVEKPFGNKKLKPFTFDATDCPDLFPPLVALASHVDGISVISGVSRLIHKESNRALALKEIFATFGILIECQDDNMIIYGGQELKGGTIHSFNDHRIVMSAAVAALGAVDPVVIHQCDAINKSYPNFFKDLSVIQKK